MSNSKALYPIAVLRAAVAALKAYLPTAVFPPPVVVVAKASCPIATLLPAVVLEPNASLPIPML